jgi:HAE1 family hydrophobic/amphiphilic exporter-1
LIRAKRFSGKSSTMIQPIGLTVTGGLVSSTMITLFFIPVLYSLTNERKRARQTTENNQQEAV